MKKKNLHFSIFKSYFLAILKLNECQKIPAKPLTIITIQNRHCP